jgi:hypothetical protein
MKLNGCSNGTSGGGGYMCSLFALLVNTVS